MQTLHISGRAGSGLTIGGVMKSVMFVGELPREPARFVCKKVAGDRGGARIGQAHELRA